MYCGRMRSLLPYMLPDVSVTVYEPGSVKVTTGSCSDEFAGVASGPNVQTHNRGALVERSVNLTVRGAGPFSGEPVKSATTRGGLAMTAFFRTIVSVWSSRLTMRVTV